MDEEVLEEFEEAIEYLIDYNIAEIDYTKIYAFSRKEKNTLDRIYNLYYNTNIFKDAKVYNSFSNSTVELTAGKFFLASVYKSSSYFKQHSKLPHCPENFCVFKAKP